MLKKVGAFIEPLTRFDKSHLNLVSCVTTSAPVTATQTFNTRFSKTEADGAGPLPGDVRRVDGPGAFETELAAMLDRARRDAANRLLAWSGSHGSNPEAELKAGDVYATEGAIGYVSTCKTCHGKGQIDCMTCLARGKVTCVRCNGTKSTTCSRCNGSSRAPCEACAGRGGQGRQVEHRGLNPATNELVIRYEQVWDVCPRCGGQKTEHCRSCNGGRVACSHCNGEGTINCTVCHGAGHTTCNTCKGQGELHHRATIQCVVTPALVIVADGGPEDVRREISGLSSMSQLLAMAGSAMAKGDASGADFSRVTTAHVDIASAEFAIGQMRLTINGYGPDFEVLDFRDIGGALLTGDVEDLEAALAARTGLIPALHGMLESETNAEIARRSGAMSKTKREADLAKLAAEFRGVASAAYAVRASNAIRKGLSRAFVGKMLQWPVYTLAAGALALPVNWLAWSNHVRNQDFPVIAGVILLAVAAAFVGNVWATGALQKQLSSRADLKIPQLVGKLGLTRNWMIIACIVAVPLATVCGAIGRVSAGF
ncbi:MAG: hypothetical protein GC155_05495 [Alphaproteobacteria bacterium]|nr:hypothetical protein [Alphaproteobacteria bacterium]